MITISYASSRNDIAEAYWAVWRRSTKMKVIQLILFSLVLAVSWSASDSGLTGLLTALTVMALSPLNPQIVFKPETRTLTIDDKGMSTTIGKEAGNISWGEVERINEMDDKIYIVGKNLHSMVIPDRAFKSSEDRATFLDRAKSWHQLATQTA